MKKITIAMLAGLIAFTASAAEESKPKEWHKVEDGLISAPLVDMGFVRFEPIIFYTKDKLNKRFAIRMQDRTSCEDGETAPEKSGELMIENVKYPAIGFCSDKNVMIKTTTTQADSDKIIESIKGKDFFIFGRLAIQSAGLDKQLNEM